MFITETENRLYAVKTHELSLAIIQVYNHGLKSYRDLPYAC